MLDLTLTIKDKKLNNRVVIQPMEGFDCLEDGSPSEITVKKYMSFAESGASLIWFEASAVCAEGRTGERQMRLTRDNIDKFKKLLQDMRARSVKKFGYAPIMVLQLTHSGRQSISPMIAYRNPVYEKTRPLSDDNVVSDEYLDSLPSLYAQTAKCAAEAGFDGVDIKACHGYLIAELLSAYTRAGKYGGSFENRTKCYLNCVDAVIAATPENFIVAARVGMTDMVKKPYGFGTDEDGNCVLDESKKLLKALSEKGVKLINITLGNPYYNPHVNRPYRKGFYVAPEKPEVGLKRFYVIGKELKREFPEMLFVGSGLSYYRENLFEKAEEMLVDGACDLVGFGRESIAYPEFYSDYINGRFQGKKCCLACSKCTILMRNKQASGCAVFNDYYKSLYKEKLK